MQYANNWMFHATRIDQYLPNDGVHALAELAGQFDVVNQNDRASAIAKVYKTIGAQLALWNPLDDPK